jgi:hypothetical protein
LVDEIEPEEIGLRSLVDESDSMIRNPGFVSISGGLGVRVEA